MSNYPRRLPGERSPGRNGDGPGAVREPFKTISLSPCMVLDHPVALAATERPCPAAPPHHATLQGATATGPEPYESLLRLYAASEMQVRRRGYGEGVEREPTLLWACEVATSTPVLFFLAK